MTREEILVEVKRLTTELDNLQAAAWESYEASWIADADHVFFRDAGDSLCDALLTLTRFLRAHR